MKPKNSLKWGLLLPLLLASGCTGSDVRHSLGMERNQPDEFQVVSRPPLSVPPVYYLKPPSADAAGGVAVDQRAQSLIFNGEEPRYQAPGASDPNYFRRTETSVVSVGETSLPTAGEEAFLRKAGTDAAKQDIRQVLVEENRPIIIEEKREKGFFEKLGGGDGSEPVVDAGKERERILTNRQEGKDVNDGDVPVIDPAQKSTLEKIFE